MRSRPVAGTVADRHEVAGRRVGGQVVVRVMPGGAVDLAGVGADTGKDLALDTQGGPARVYRLEPLRGGDLDVRRDIRCRRVDGRRVVEDRMHRVVDVLPAVTVELVRPLARG